NSPTVDGGSLQSKPQLLSSEAQRLKGDGERWAPAYQGGGSPLPCSSAQWSKASAFNPNRNR
ncbi:MAG: hypothetical protein IJ668_04700, partial [Selenomonadaceae bacterium]|nr:hypothetical protein [Selenomonadaceae bacterium]